jgi:predicted alpha/beta-hydrolase family hydrolase
MPVRTQIFDFTGSQGQRLSGRLDLPEATATAYAVLAHCFTCGKNSVVSVRIARALAARGIGVLRFDFTGLGQSEGDFSHTTFSGPRAKRTLLAERDLRGLPAVPLVRAGAGRWSDAGGRGSRSEAERVNGDDPGP